MQIGLAWCTKTTGCGGDANGAGEIPADGFVHFWYTKFDDAGGRVYLADSWYGKRRVLGQRYRLKVERNGSNWGYFIRNVTAAEAYTMVYRNATWGPTGTTAWWGGEVFYTSTISSTTPGTCGP